MMRNFFVDKGTIFLFDYISRSIGLLDLSRFCVVLYRSVLYGVLFFLKAPFDIPSGGLDLSLSVERRAMKRVE